MKKLLFVLFICVYGFSLITAILLLIFKSRISEDSYFIAQLLLFGYSILTSMPLFLPGFIAYLVWLLKKIFNNNVTDPDEFPESAVSWLYIVLFVFVLDVFFGLTLIIPIAVIIQSSYILFELIIVYKTLISESPE